MRSTKASAAIDRLKRRSGNEQYSMTLSGGGLFSLVLADSAGESSRLCEPMMLDEFVAFVNAYGPQTPKRVSRLDVEFAKQLVKKETS
ncbi:MAG TPA: hypothetical protein VES38_08350 [Methylotenera sp.]|nr:hypothetical protein [Methylotenera sp.]